MKDYVFTPGPVPVPSEALIEMAKPIIHHRTAEFEGIIGAVREDLKYIHRTSREVMTLASSGTGAMEAAVSNTLRRGDRALVVNGGKFGERWTKICAAFGVEVEEIKVEWGFSVDPVAVEEALKADPSIRAVLMQASETSTGIKNPTAEIAAITRERDDVILIVDGITAVGVFPLPFDELGIDVLVAGSQKAFMLPPGLSFIALSDKAWEFAKTSDLPKFYFDLAAARKSAEKNTTPWTPAVSLIRGLSQVLKMFRAEGLENMHRRHEALAFATRSAFKAMGMELFTKDEPSPALSVAVAPPEIGAGPVIKALKDDFGMTVAGGQDRAKGKIFRVSHIGYIDRSDTMAVVSAVEQTLGKLGHEFDFGAGSAAAAAVLSGR
ncbi:MAG: alanine--glyoxylate aminotransferase family protein [Candidatus Dadabacteria bacterium]|nr:alanine--glyoxylate aminotransferase family protein [Candidatus Dadabacteria bacterium]